MGTKRSFRKFLSLCCAVFIFSSTMITSLYVRPMEVYAASVALEFGEGFLSLVADVLFSFGCKFSKYANAAAAAVSFTDFTEKRRVEILAEAAENPDYLKEQLRFGYKAKDDTRDKEVVITKEKMVSAADWVDTHKADDKIDSLSDLPEEFVQAAQAFAVSELNISALDGTALITIKYLSAVQWFNAQPALKLDGYSRDGRYHFWSSAKVWVSDWGSSSKCYFYAMPGTVINRYDAYNGTTNTATFSSAQDNGICAIRFWAQDSSFPYPASLDAFRDALGYDGDIPNLAFPYNFNAASFSFPFNFAYTSAPSVDVSYVGAGAVAWDGTADIATTIDNQNAASSQEEYVGKTLTASGEVVVPTEAPTESEGSGESGGDISLSGIIDWLSKIYNGVIALPKNLVSAFDSALAGLGTRIDGIPAALADIGERISTIPDDIGKELAKLGDWLQTIPGTLAGINDSVLAVPKAIGAEISAFFAIDTVQINNSFSDMTDALKAKLSALNQIIDIFDKTNYSFSDTPPIIRMKTPDALKFAIHDDEMVIMDLTQFAELFSWCRTILAAMMWVAFGKWVIDQFDVKFHVG
ncbi:hypothetical protein [Clostridium transplantifaecale]|uniref:hypothetical protein n=1 Tax=Clostridium transplantifaecale TaxID=2479838 RepID=UPI000F63F5DD|nr:hypothetical protein [Clostridium transplantifaecale]